MRVNLTHRYARAARTDSSQLDLFADDRAAAKRADGERFAAVLAANQARFRESNDAFNAALDLGPTPMTWRGGPCAANCGRPIWQGELCVRANTKRGGLVHEGCA